MGTFRQLIRLNYSSSQCLDLQGRGNTTNTVIWCLHGQQDVVKVKENLGESLLPELPHPPQGRREDIPLSAVCSSCSAQSFFPGCFNHLSQQYNQIRLLPTSFQDTHCSDEGDPLKMVKRLLKCPPPPDSTTPSPASCNFLSFPLMSAKQRNHFQQGSSTSWQG